MKGKRINIWASIGGAEPKRVGFANDPNDIHYLIGLYQRDLGKNAVVWAGRKTDRWKPKEQP